MSYNSITFGMKGAAPVGWPPCNTALEGVSIDDRSIGKTQGSCNELAIVDDMPGGSRTPVPGGFALGHQ